MIPAEFAELIDSGIQASLILVRAITRFCQFVSRNPLLRFLEQHIRPRSKVAP